MKRVVAWTHVAALLALLGASASAEAQSVRYYHLDSLGSVRALTDASGAVLERHDYLPFGEECTTGPCAGNPGVEVGGPRKFTDKERDTETGLDYFGARYYGSRIGRFTSVDPAYVLSANLVDPQLWNRYAYVRNNPLRYTDPDGRLLDVLADVAAIEYDLLDIGVTLWTGGELESTHFKALGGDVLGAAVPFLTGVGAGIRAAAKVDRGVDAGRGTSNIVESARRGRESEARTLEALGQTKNTKKVQGCEGCSIPDYQNATTIGEIKDAARVDNTRQIRIQREAAERSGREHVIQAGTNAQVSKNVQRGATRVERRSDLGPQ